MLRKKFFITTLLSCLFITNGYALQNSSTTLTLVNHSSETLSYTGVTCPNSNTFTVNPVTLPPNGTMKVIGTIDETSDLAGNLHLVNENNKKYNFVVNVKQMYHMGKPIFAFDSHNSNLTTQIISTTFNTSKQGRELSYIAAEVVIIDR